MMRNLVFQILLFTVLFINSATSAKAAIGFKNCSQSEIQQLTYYTAEAKNLIASWTKSLNQISTKAHTLFPNSTAASSPKTQKKVHGAIQILACSYKKLGKMDYKCGYSPDKNWDAQTLPLFGNNVKLNQRFFESSPDRIVGMLIHEASHKCGTTDAFYFNDYYTPPQDNGLISWDNIADTYEYWSEFRFCIPEINCH